MDGSLSAWGEGIMAAVRGDEVTILRLLQGELDDGLGPPLVVGS